MYLIEEICCKIIILLFQPPISAGGMHTERMSMNEELLADITSRLEAAKVKIDELRGYL